MSIQSSINQTLAIAGAVATQTPAAAVQKEKALQKAQLKKIDKGLENIDKQEITAQTELDAEKGERRDALISDMDKHPERYPEGVKKSILNAYDKEVEEKEKAFNDLTKVTTEEKLGLLNQKGSITGDYEPYITTKYNAAAANAKADAAKLAKKEQSQEVSDKIKLMHEIIRQGGYH